MTKIHLVDRIEIGEEEFGLYLVAGSFEPRSVQATKLLEGRVDRAVVFSYDDARATESGRQNLREIETCLRNKSQAVNVLYCLVRETFSVVRAIHTFVTRELLVGTVRSVVVDATCFTKLHLLLLLRFLSDWLGVEVIRICYTKPLVYATSFRKELSYGIHKTEYIPYRGVAQVGDKTGLIALLGHEPRRLERLVQEIEPDVCVIVIGEPGFTDDMAAYSKEVNASLIRRAKYDHHYRIAYAPVDDVARCVEVLAEQLSAFHKEDCMNVYLAPLGTKLQAIAVELLSQLNETGRLSLAYAIPERYEHRSYSQGIGETVTTTIENQPQSRTGIVPIPKGGVVVTDDDVRAIRDEFDI